MVKQVQEWGTQIGEKIRGRTGEGKWGARPVSNRQPLDPQSSALPLRYGHHNNVDYSMGDAARQILFPAILPCCFFQLQRHFTHPVGQLFRGKRFAHAVNDQRKGEWCWALDFADEQLRS